MNIIIQIEAIFKYPAKKFSSERFLFYWMGSGNSKPKRRVLFLGLDNAGKTTILKAMCNEAPTSIAPTRGFNVKQLKVNKLELNIWDIGGQRALRAYWQNYYDKVNGIVWVVDSADERRLEETGEELAALLQEEKLAGAPVIILANKQDLATAKPADEISTSLNLHMIRNRNWQIQACSAVNGTGLKESLAWLEQNLK